MKEIETIQSTPEQLLKMLDVQMAMRRAERGRTGRNRTVFMVGGLLFIVIAAGAALMVLSQIISDLPHGERRPAAVPASEPVAGNF